MAGLPLALVASVNMLGGGWSRTWRFECWSEGDGGIWFLACGSGLGSSVLGSGIFSWQVALEDLARDVGRRGWCSGGEERRLSNGWLERTTWPRLVSVLVIPM